MKRVILLGLIISSTLLAQSHYEASASVESKGGHSVNGKSLVDDISDVYNFPAQVAETPDVAQGTVVFDPTDPSVTFMQGSAFVVKALTDKISVGLVFGKGSAVDASGMSTLLGTGAVAGVISQINGVLPGYNFTGVVTPSNAAHFLLGLKLGSDLKLGLDLYREASNASSKDHDVTLNVTNQKRIVDEEMFVKYGALGINAGIDMKLGDISIKGVAGFASLGFNAENHEFGTDYDNSKLPDITNIIETESGLYIPATAKASMSMGAHKITGGIDFLMASHAYIGKHTDITGAVTTTTEEKSNMYSLMSIGAGFLDEMAVGENTRVYASLSVNRQSTTSTPPDSITRTDPEITAYDITMPKTSVGVEHRINNLWKFDALLIRAGGFKTYGWTSGYSEGGESIQEDSDYPSSVPFVWTTGIGFVMGKVNLDLTIRPDRWNGIYLVSGKGPYGGTVTMTYNY
jgi:hypothetical protein